MNSVTFKKSATWVQDQGLAAWVENDPRSVKAMLRGRGDHRVAVYEKFVSKVRKEQPNATQEMVDEAYRLYSRKEHDRLYRVSTLWLRRLFVFCNTHLKGAHVLHFTFFCLILKWLDTPQKF